MRTQRLLQGVLLTSAILILPPATQAGEKPKYPTIGSIERLDLLFDKLVPKDAVIEKLAEGFAWTEGPVWVSDAS